MERPPFNIEQNIFKAPHSPIRATTLALSALTPKILDEFLDTIDDGMIGMAPAYGPDSILSVVAFASTSRVLLVHMPKAKAKGKSTGEQGRALLKGLLISPSRSKFAFQMDVLAASLHLDLDLRIHGGVDLLSMSLTNDRYSLQARMNSMGGEVKLQKANVYSLFRAEENMRKSSLEDVALQAWVAWRAGTLDNLKITPLLDQAPRINTTALNKRRLSVFAQMIRVTRCLDALKPTSMRNEIADSYSIRKGQLEVTCTRFKNRIRAKGEHIEIEAHHLGQRQTFSASSGRVDGRAVTINLKSSSLPPGPIKVTSIGKEALTGAEGQRVLITLRALQGTTAIADQPFFQAIWLPEETISWPAWTPCPVPISFDRPLNASQKLAVKNIVSDKPITVIHGPPGTGKTTVIAAAVVSIRASARDRTVWLVAQSNVAVKNIAEKLASVGFWDFKLLVSKDFHHDWHEHLYADKLERNLVRSDEFPKELIEAERLLLGAKIILCTLSMLSNPRISAFTRVVPIETVIVDEASQVEIGNFLPMISLYSTTLRKLVFIGDDKQLAPYGQSDVPSLKSVFEMAHLKKDAIFLDTQYRMPTQLGQFIGQQVYKGKLKTVHDDTTQCCQFIDVKNSKEEMKGGSWMNEEEIKAVVGEARSCVNKGRSYRIVTPYDAQRGMLEGALKREKDIPWEDKVFCVDSFQGNEDDYIILSIVRTEKIGFLAEPRRVNVMLSRCKKGMRIFTSRGFVEGKAKDSLVGRLAMEIGETAWES